MELRPAETRERILAAAEDAAAAAWPAKTTVADVARALGMSHANVYRHFASKAELRDVVAERWLHAVTDPLDGHRRRRRSRPGSAGSPGCGAGGGQAAQGP